MTKVGSEMFAFLISLLCFGLSFSFGFGFGFESAGSVDARPCVRKENGDLDRMLPVRPKAGDGDEGA
jgi:hypothetical protein